MVKQPTVRITQSNSGLAAVVTEGRGPLFWQTEIVCDAILACARQSDFGPGPLRPRSRWMSRLAARAPAVRQAMAADALSEAIAGCRGAVCE